MNDGLLAACNGAGTAATDTPRAWGGGSVADGRPAARESLKRVEPLATQGRGASLTLRTPKRERWDSGEARSSTSPGRLHRCAAGMTEEDRARSAPEDADHGHTRAHHSILELQPNAAMHTECDLDSGGRI